MTENNYCVYVHTNKINGKKYVGITKRDVKARWQHGNGYKRHKKFYNAILKYGWDGFEHEVLFKGLTLEEANVKERELIKFYDSMNNGYNLTQGGDGSPGCAHTEEAKQKMSESRKNREITEEWRRHLGEALKGRPCPTKGEKLTEEHKEKISLGLKEYYQNNKEAHNRKRNKFPAIPVLCDGREFESIKVCADFYNIDNAVMARWLCGKSFIPEEFVRKGLRYKNSDSNYVLYELKVKQVYYNGVIYNSICECSRMTGHSERTLMNWIKKDSYSQIYLIPVYKYKISHNNI